MENNEIELYSKLMILYNSINKYNSYTISLSINCFDFDNLKNSQHFDRLFKIETNVKGETLINGILLLTSPLCPKGTFYLQQKI
jgi:hypothetical protein